MASRPHTGGPEDFKAGRILGWPAGQGGQRDVACRVRYVADAKHKNYPAPNREWELVAGGHGEKCDRVPPAVWPQIQLALCAAVEAGVVHYQFRGEFPARLSVYVNGRLNEARISNHITGEYHGFPLEHLKNYPADPYGYLAKAPRIEF